MSSREDKLRRLREEVTLLLGADDDEFEYRASVVSGVPRHEWTRKIPGALRYLRIAPLMSDQVPEWDFELLGGEEKETGGEGFDGRRGGDFEYTIEFFRRWMIQLDDWDEIPR